MSRIEKNSTETKDDLVSSIIKKVKNNDLSDTFHMIRGNVYNTENIHLIGIMSSEENTAVIKGLVNEYENNKMSRHQVDYIVSSFVNDMSVASIGGLQSMNPVERIGYIKDTAKKALEAEAQKTLVLLIMSKEGVEMITYGIIESVIRNEVSIVVSPEPILHINSPHSETKVLIGSSELVNFFSLDEKEKTVLRKCDLHMDQMLKIEGKLFPVKSKFIKKRDEKSSKDKSSKHKKKKIKFGY